MHALHRRHLPRAMAVTFIAAVLAIVLTLALAAPLNDLASQSAPTGSTEAPTAVHGSTTSPRWNLSPFAPLVSAPTSLPWAPAHP